MGPLRLLMSGLLVITVAASSQAQDKPDFAKMIVGTWEVTKGDKSTVQDGSRFTFDNAGNLTMMLVFDKQMAQFEATYKVDGDKMVTMVKGSKGKGRTVTLKKISDKELVWEEFGGKSAKLVELTRK